MENIKNKISTPLAIIAAGAMIGLAILITKSASSTNSINQPVDEKKDNSEIKISSVGDNDHILGNLNAKVIVVEYSDTECPFCKSFHDTMHQIVDNYGNKVAWVYRHFPIDALHSKAREEAKATECAASLAGNDGFWKYIDKIYEITPSNNGLDPHLLLEIANEIGIDKQKFETCLSSQQFKDKINNYISNGAKAGVKGTPYSLVLVNGKVVDVINGAQPLDQVKAIIDKFL
jgi:protein-disulfide isomerase